MDGWIWAELHECMYDCVDIHIYTYLYTECNSWQYVFQSKNT